MRDICNLSVGESCWPTTMDKGSRHVVWVCRIKMCRLHGRSGEPPHVSRPGPLLEPLLRCAAPTLSTALNGIQSHVRLNYLAQQYLAQHGCLCHMTCSASSTLELHTDGILDLAAFVDWYLPLFLIGCAWQQTLGHMLSGHFCEPLNTPFPFKIADFAIAFVVCPEHLLMYWLAVCCS